MSIFDRFASKEMGGQKRKPFLPTSSKRVFAELDEAAGEAREQYPDDSKVIEDFVWALKAACKDRRKKALDGDMSPMKAQAQFFLSQDRMTAYACLLPPENDGDEITLEEFLRDMRYEGIVCGILQETIPQGFAQGYLRMFPVARGTPFRPGEDGKVVELFRRRSHMQLEVQSGDQVDFSEDVQLQPIRKGSAICLIRAPKPGGDGMDVTGAVLPCPPVFRPSIPQGKNVELGRGGQALLAGVNGILYIDEDGRFCIHEQKIIDGDLDQFQGTLQISGNLYIGGNVDSGAEIEATGDIVINGKMGQAKITSTGGIIRVQKGVYGADGKTFLTAAGQVQSPVLEWADVNAGASVIAEAIVDSVIHCGGTVYAMTGRGMIANSRIWAGESVLCLRVGNLAGGRSRFSVGYPPHIPESWERIRAELKESYATVEKLWDTITELRRKGSHMTERERALLGQLTEQRDLYSKRVEELREELRSVNKALDKKSKGRIRCEELNPFLDVQIGRLMEEIGSTEEKCNIHVEDNCIRLK